MRRALWKVGLVLWGIGLLLSSSASAFELTGQDWTYMANPMGEDWNVCPSGMPGSGVQRTTDGAFEWNYSEFEFTFGSGACLSGGTYPTFNNVNQVDFGGGLEADTLAQTTWWYNTSTGDILECDIRFHNTFSWYTGTGTPPSNQYDWWGSAAHVMGFCLGLGNENDITDPKPVMYQWRAPGEVRRNLTADDIAGRNAIYGEGPPLTFIRPMDDWDLNGYQFGDDWKWNRCEGLLYKHAGVDVNVGAATVGKAVKASASGVVKEVCFHPVWKYALVLEHDMDGNPDTADDRVTTVYWHIDPDPALLIDLPTTKGCFPVSPEVSVEQGEQIATVANLGNLSHLHFGLRWAPYKLNLSDKGALPPIECKGLPAFPEAFVDPLDYLETD